jgi:hypothetical protein
MEMWEGICQYIACVNYKHCILLLHAVVSLCQGVNDQHVRRDEKYKTSCLFERRPAHAHR